MSLEPGHGAREVVPGLMLGGLGDLRVMLDWKPDVLVPLDRLPGYVWETGWRGELLYYPITDFFVLPRDVLERLTEDVAERLRAGKRVAMFCVGGHGRTGYAAACVLSRLGQKNPIAFLRKNYSPAAVESDEQELEVEWYCQTHE